MTATVLVVLSARTLAYALVPTPSLVPEHLEREAGGPSLVVVSLVSLGLALALATAILWVVGLAVRERLALEQLPVVEEPRVRLRLLAVCALCLWLATSLAFALLESYLHWRAGLGWHGIDCLVGPVHRDAIPLLAGLSVVASAVLAALELLVAWARRVFALLRTRPLPRKTSSPIGPVVERSNRFESVLLFSSGARAPPSHASRTSSSHRPEGKAEMHKRSSRSRRALALTLVGAAALVIAAGASAHARISPSIVEAGADEVFTLSVPTEKADATTTKIELTTPSGFPIDSVEPPPPGWTMAVKASGAGEEEVIQSVTWSGGHVPTGQDAMFRFNAGAQKAKTYRFSVRQTYSDGSVVDWTGPESSDTPTAIVKAVSSLGGGGGTSTLTIVALILGAAGLIVGIVALVSRGGRAIA